MQIKSFLKWPSPSLIFLCPTEIAAMNAKYDEFQSVLAVSVDTKFSHKRFVETEPILKGLKLTIGADGNQALSKAFGVLGPLKSFQKPPLKYI